MAAVTDDVRRYFLQGAKPGYLNSCPEVARQLNEDDPHAHYERSDVNDFKKKTLTDLPPTDSHGKILPEKKTRPKKISPPFQSPLPAGFTFVPTSDAPNRYRSGEGNYYQRIAEDTYQSVTESGQPILDGDGNPINYKFRGLDKDGGNKWV